MPFAGQPPLRPRSWRTYVQVGSLVVISALAFRVSEVRPGALFCREGLFHVSEFLLGLFPPRVDAAFLRSLAWPVVETVAIAIVGVSLAVLLALPLALLAVHPRLIAGGSNRNPGGLGAMRRALYHGARGLLTFLRTVPEVMWALMFVRAVGLGPVPGALAIAIAYAGAVGKVFAEILEGVPRKPIDGLHAVGASGATVLLFGALPQAVPLLVSYTFYRFDCALRSSAVLGLVGAGGLGFQLELSLKMMEYGEVATELLLLFGLVGWADGMGAAVRRRCGVRSESLRSAEVAGSSTTKNGAPSLRMARWRKVALLGTYLLLLALSAEVLGLGPSALLSALGGLGAFFVRAFPPDASPALLAQVMDAAVETLGMSLAGTLVGAIGAVPLAVFGLRGVPTRRRPWTLLVSLPLRWARNLLRSVPPLVLALVAVLLVGIGPFAGVIAIALHTAGVLSRLYAEVIEEVAGGPSEAYRAMGAREGQVLWFAVLPQALPQCLAYVLYRWEVNLREAVMLGVVGAGGLGQLMYVSMSLFHEHQTLSLIVCLLLLATLVERASAALRLAILFPRGRPAQRITQIATRGARA